MTGFRARVTARPNLRASLHPYTNPGVDKHLHEAALEVEARAKQLAPVDQGRLRASIQASRVREGVYAVTAHAAYAAFVEFGTLLQGQRSPQPGGVPADYRFGSPPAPGPGGGQLRGWAKRVVGDAGAAYAIAAKIRSEGIRAQPYLRPAAQQVRDLLMNPRRWTR